jgi:hypothetical protein
LDWQKHVAAAICFLVCPEYGKFPSLNIWYQHNYSFAKLEQKNQKGYQWGSQRLYIWGLYWMW